MRELSVQCPYGKSVTFRRSGMSKAAWEYTVHKFNLTQEPENVQSITIEGEDDYGHLLLRIVVDE